MPSVKRSGLSSLRSKTSRVEAPMLCAGGRAGCAHCFHQRNYRQTQRCGSHSASVSAMVTSLIEAWGWEATDVIPLFLPLHHVHGIVNILFARCGGARRSIFTRGLMPSRSVKRWDDRYSVFMAVPLRQTHYLSKDLG